MNFGDTFNFIMGISVTGAGSALFITAIYLMARHATLLFAGVRRQQSSDQKAKKYLYSFFVQNVEDVAYPGHLEVLIISGGSCDSLTRDDICVFAGPKRVDFESVTSVRENNFTCGKLTFEKLPPYDTWLITCASNAPSLKLRIVTPDPGSWWKRRLVIDLWPREVQLDTISATRVSIGGSLTPRTVMLAIIAIASGLMYAGLILLAGQTTLVGHTFGRIGSADLVALAFLLLVLWHAFRKIQRPIYPIMQGYLYPTPLTYVDDCRKSAGAPRAS